PLGRRLRRLRVALRPLLGTKLLLQPIRLHGGSPPSSQANQIPRPAWVEALIRRLADGLRSATVWVAKSRFPQPYSAGKTTVRKHPTPSYRWRREAVKAKRDGPLNTFRGIDNGHAGHLSRVSHPPGVHFGPSSPAPADGPPTSPP